MDSNDFQHFDLIIVGGGSGNSIISREFSHLSIALIDNGQHFGGTCLNAGCIPTKMFVHVADIAADSRDSSPLGLENSPGVVDWPAIRERVFSRTDGLSDAGLENRVDKIPNVTVFRDTFVFTDTHELLGNSGVRLRGDRIVIAAGSRPRQLADVPAIEDLIGTEDGHAGSGIYTSDSIMRIDELPATLVIIGGGAVGVEFAHVFSALGVAVTQVVRAATLLTGESIDDAIATAFTEQARLGWRVITGANVRRVSSTTGPSRYQIDLDDGSQLQTEAVLVALGRIPNTDTLGLADAGFDLHADGRLVVDDQQRVLCDATAREGIYALGDVSSAWQLKHVANHQSRVVQHNLLHPQDQIGGEPGPVVAAIFSRPQVASFGPTERMAPEDAVVVTRRYGSTAWGWALEDTENFCKLIVDRSTGVVLGAHLVGPEASILIQPLVMAASLSLPVAGLARSMYWPHPAATEIVENALLDAEKELASEVPVRRLVPEQIAAEAAAPQSRKSTHE